ncbi:MAG TPA: hypothetical protein PK657_12785 [Legionella sp.]|nr:hypothetical protein [Legionella sp.]
MYNINWPIVVDIAMPVILLIIGAGLNHFFERRARVITYLGHVSGIKLSKFEPPLTIYTHSIVIKNNGRKVANDIRLGHHTLPDFQVYPDIEYNVRDLPGGQKEIIIPKLIPKKEVTITYLYIPPITWDTINSHLESDDGPIQVIRVLPTPQIPPWAIRLLWFLISYGSIALLYTIWLIWTAFYTK